MTVATDIDRSGPYAGAGTTGPFVVGFPFAANSHLKVIQATAAGVETILALNTDYTVDGGGGGTGTVTTVNPVAVGVTITIDSDVPFTQLRDYAHADDFPAEMHEGGLDHLTRLCQQLRRLVLRAVRAPEFGVTLPEMPPIAARANRLLGFDSDGNPVGVLPSGGDATALALDLLNSADSSKGVGQIGYNPSLPYPSNLGLFLNFVFARTVAEIAVGITPINHAFPEGHFRRYGASTASGNNAAAINAALLISANGGAEAFIPPGTWAYTETLNATLSSSMRGCGQRSVLAPNGCHGITFTNQPAYAGARFFRDFYMLGTNTDVSHVAIFGDMAAASGHRVTGITFSGIGIENFNIAIRMRGFWACYFLNVFGFRCWFGVYCNGQNVQITFESCFFHKHTATSAGNSRGVLIDSISGESTQSLRLLRFGTYEYDLGIDADLALAFHVLNCDISECNIYGIRITTHQGGVTVRDSWVQMSAAGAAGTGIVVSAMAGPTMEKITIDANNIIATTLHASNCAIDIGDNQDAVIVTGNRVSTNWQTGIRTSGSDNTIIRYNSIKAAGVAVAINSLGVNQVVGPNTIESGTPLAFTALTPPGFEYYARGSFTMTLTGMTGATTFSMNWVANGHTVSLMTPAAGIAGTSNTTAMTGTGLPNALWPVSDQVCIPTVINSGAVAYGYASVDSATGVITFGKDAAASAFTASGSKGLGAMTAIYTYS